MNEREELRMTCRLLLEQIDTILDLCDSEGGTKGCTFHLGPATIQDMAAAKAEAETFLRATARSARR